MNLSKVNGSRSPQNASSPLEAPAPAPAPVSAPAHPPSPAEPTRYTQAANNQFNEQAGPRSKAHSSGEADAPRKWSRDRVLDAKARAKNHGKPAILIGGEAPPASAEDKFLSRDAAKKIHAAERDLKRAGFDPGKVDSRLGARSREALSDFQRAAGLAATGQLDRQTSRRLKRVAERVREHHGELLGQGQSSAKVRDAERKLRKLGYDPGRVDGVFDAKTASAVRQFRKDQPELSQDTHLLGKTSRASLNKEARALDHTPFRHRVRDTPEHKRAERRVLRAAARLHADGTRGLGQGATNKNAVRTVQQHLKAAGYDPKRDDGFFDQRTAGVVEAFQRKSGLEPTGRVDSETWRKLRRAKMEADGPTSPRQGVGEISGAVEKTEALLEKLGMHPGKVDGRYTERTQKAVDRFRARHKLGGLGKGVDSATLGRMKKAAAGGSGRKARHQMQALLDVARRNASGKRPLGYCLKSVQDYLDQVSYGKGRVPRLPYARNYAEYLNSNGNAARLGLQRLPIHNPYAAPPGAIVVVRAGTPGTHHPTAGDIVVRGEGMHLYNDGEMSYGGPGNFPPGNNYVLGVYVPRGGARR